MGVHNCSKKVHMGIIIKMAHFNNSLTFFWPTQSGRLYHKNENIAYYDKGVYRTHSELTQPRYFAPLTHLTTAKFHSFFSGANRQTVVPLDLTEASLNANPKKPRRTDMREKSELSQLLMLIVWFGLLRGKKTNNYFTEVKTTTLTVVQYNLVCCRSN